MDWALVFDSSLPRMLKRSQQHCWVWSFSLEALRGYSIVDCTIDQLRLSMESSIDSRMTICSIALLFRPTVVISARTDVWFKLSFSPLWIP